MNSDTSFEPTVPAPGSNLGPAGLFDANVFLFSEVHVLLGLFQADHVRMRARGVPFNPVFKVLDSILNAWLDRHADSGTIGTPPKWLRDGSEQEFGFQEFLTSLLHGHTILAWPYRGDLH